MTQKEGIISKYSSITKLIYASGYWRTSFFGKLISSGMATTVAICYFINHGNIELGKNIQNKLNTVALHKYYEK